MTNQGYYNFCGGLCRRLYTNIKGIGKTVTLAQALFSLLGCKFFASVILSTNPSSQRQPSSKSLSLVLASRDPPFMRFWIFWSRDLERGKIHFLVYICSRDYRSLSDCFQRWCGQLVNLEPSHFDFTYNFNCAQFQLSQTRSNLHGSLRVIRNKMFHRPLEAELFLTLWLL